MKVPEGAGLLAAIIHGGEGEHRGVMVRVA